MLGACSVSKHVPEGEYILNKVEVKSDDKSYDASSLKPYVRQKEAPKIFSLFRNPFSRKPVIFDTLQARLSCQDLRVAMQNQGFLQAGVSLFTTTKGKKLDAQYLLHPGEPFRIGKMTYVVDDDEVRKVLSQGDESLRLLKPGMRFSVEALDAERKRIARLLADSGYFRFNKDFIQYDADTISGEKDIDLKLHLLNYKASSNQPATDHPRYWIRQVNPDLLIKALGYIAYSDDAIICLIAIAVLIVLLRIYKKESKDAGEKERFLILSGARVYIGTILLAVIFSIVFKPILMPRYLLPAAAVMWLTISIIFSKIKSKELFMISAALIALLLLIGITTTISTNDYFYNSGVHQKEILENITNDPNSMLIINNQNMIMYFLSYTNQTDTYCMNVDRVFGENMTQLHKFYDFNTFNTRDIDKLISNNTGKNIYIISWSDPVIKTPTEKIDAWAGVTISKAKTSNGTSVSTNE